MLRFFSAGTAQRVREVTSRIIEYIRQNYPAWADCPDQDLRAWLTWHWCQGLIAAMCDPQDGKLCALVVARLLDEPDGYEKAYLHNPSGRICHVELAISEEPEALQAAIALLLSRFSKIPLYVMHERGAKGIGVRLRPWKRYSSLLEKL